MNYEISHSKLLQRSEHCAIVFVTFYGFTDVLSFFLMLFYHHSKDFPLEASIEWSDDIRLATI